MLSYAVKTDLGNQRENNEDYYLASPDLCLWIMADGVGGQDGGEIASQLACSVIKSQVEEGVGLVEAINIAHKTIKQSAKKGLGRIGMATTIVALLVHGDEYQVAWVGDSRAYLWTDNTLHQLSHDQSLVQRLLDENIITPTEALHHPRRNLVIQALGQEGIKTVDVETVVGEFKDGDKIILCSDGLTDYVNDEQMSDLLATYTDNDILVDKLVSAALTREGKDNITVMAVNMLTKAITETQQVDVAQVERAVNEQRMMQWMLWLLPLIIVGVVIGTWIF